MFVIVWIGGDDDELIFTDLGIFSKSRSRQRVQMRLDLYLKCL